MKMIRNLTAVSLTTIAVLSLSACAFTEGVKPDANVGTSLQKGISTESDVDARLGQPEKSVTNPNGTHTVTYHYGEAKINPLVLLGTSMGSTGQDVITTVTFDRNGKFLSLAQETDNHTSGSF
jgi:hypothetical protein